MASLASQPISLHRLLSTERDLVNDGKARNRYKNNKISGSNPDLHHHHHHRHHQRFHSKTKAKPQPTFPMVVRFARSKLDNRSRAFLENSRQPSSSSSSSFCDTAGLLTLLELLEKSGSQQAANNNISNNTNNTNNNNGHRCFVVQDMEYINLLLGEELNRKSNDGSLVATGRKFEFPRYFDGWFEILSQDGGSPPQIADVCSLVKKQINNFITTKPTTILVHSSSSYAAGIADVRVATTHGEYATAVLGVGHELKAIQVVKLNDGGQYLSCRIVRPGHSELVKRNSEEKREEQVLLPLSGQGRFLPISGNSNLTDAHDVGFLMSKLRMPVIVRVYWPTGSKTAAPSTQGKPGREGKKSGFIQKKWNSKQDCNSSNDIGSSTILRIHGHHKQKVIYITPFLQSYVVGSPTTEEVDGDLKLLALRGQVCRFFDVVQEPEVNIKPDVVERLRKRKYLLQSAFEKEVKVFDPTMYKMTGEKLVVNKQPITLSMGNDVTIIANQSDDLPLGCDYQHHCRASARRQSLPPDVAMLGRRHGDDGREDGIRGDDDDDESVLMNEIENIYMRVRYWDRSVRYPMPQKQHPKPQQQQRPQQQQQQQQQQQRLQQQQQQQQQRQQQRSQHQISKNKQPVDFQTKQKPSDLAQAVAVLRQTTNDREDKPNLPQLPPLPPLPQTPLPQPPQTPSPSTSHPEITPANTSGESSSRKGSLGDLTATSAAVASAAKTTPAPNKDIKGAVRNVFKNLVKKNKGSMDVAKLAGSEFAYFNMQHPKP